MISSLFSLIRNEFIVSLRRCQHNREHRRRKKSDASGPKKRHRPEAMPSVDFLN